LQKLINLNQRDFLKEEIELSEREIIDGLRKAIVNYDDDAAKKWAEDAVKKNIDPLKAIQ
jgi:methanogenic corrinoid protein MtbC1